MRIVRVSLGVSALAVAIIVVYGYLFGMQSAWVLIAPSGGLLDFYYFAIVAMAAGAVAAILVVRSGLSARPVVGESVGYGLGHGLAYGALMGVVTGGLLVVWQMLFDAIVNILMRQPGLFLISSANPYPTNPQVVFIGAFLDLYLTLTYSMFEGLVVFFAGMLAGGITGSLHGRYARVASRSDIGRPLDTA